MRGYFRKHEFNTFLKRFPFEDRVYHRLSDLYARAYDVGEADDIFREYLKSEVTKEEADRIVKSLSSIRNSEDLRMFISGYGKSFFGFDKKRVENATKAIGEKSSTQVNAVLTKYHVPAREARIIFYSAEECERLRNGNVLPGKTKEECQFESEALSIRCVEDLCFFMENNRDRFRNPKHQIYDGLDELRLFIEGFGFSNGATEKLIDYSKELEKTGEGTLYLQPKIRSDHTFAIGDAESVMEFLKRILHGKIYIKGFSVTTVEKLMKIVEDQMKEPAWLGKKEDILPEPVAEPTAPADIQPVQSEQETVQRFLDACMLIGAVADDLKTFAEAVKRCSEDIRAACELMQSANKSK